MTEHRLVCRYSETKGLDHTLCTAAGFASFAMQSTGKSIEHISMVGRSIDPSRKVRPSSYLEELAQHLSNIVSPALRGSAVTHRMACYPFRTQPAW